MKKVLGLVVLMMVMLISVSGLAQTTPSATDTTTVEVWLNVPEFVSIEASPTGQKFELVLDPANPGVNLSDTVTLWAEANVNYTVNFQKFPVTTNLPSSMSQQDVNAWVDSLTISLTPTSGTPGTQQIDATATLDLSGGLPTYDVIDPSTKIADVIFTISSTN